MRFLFRKRLRAVPAFQDTVPPEVEADLGLYVYALCDPATGRPFYVGQGRNARPNDHFAEAVEAQNGRRALTSKTETILAIWKDGEAVEIVFLRHNLGSPEALDDVEGAAIAALNLGAEEPLTNLNQGNAAEERGFLSLEAACGRFAPPVDPGPYDAVFVFNITQSRARGLDPYEAARGDWSFGDQARAWNAVAVGLERGVSTCCFRVDDWEPVEEKWAFIGEPVEAEDLLGKSWRHITEANRFWQRRGCLVVCFDGEGEYRTIWGGGRDEEWRPLAGD